MDIASLRVGRAHGKPRAVFGRRSQVSGATARARFGCALVTAALLACGAARAEDAVSARAHEAYDRGAEAFKRGDFGVAARAFAEADALVPSAVALHAALDAAVRADDPVLGTQLLDRASRAPADEALDATIRVARARFARRTGRVRVACGACKAAIDGVPIDVGVAVVVRTGPHTATIDAGVPEQRAIDVPADDTVVLSPRAASIAPPPARSGGLSPAWVFVGAGATAIAGGLGIASAVDTSNRHADFVRSGCDRVGSGACSAASSDGASAQSRTNVLLGVTAALGVATAAIALFAVRWKSDASVTVGLVQGSPGASLRLSFQ